MSENKRSNESPRTATTSVIDTHRDNTLRIIDEVAKAQPQYAQAISNLQTDFIQTTRKFVETAFESEKQLAQHLNLPQNPQISELVARQSNEFASNVIRVIGTYNQLAINALNAARENSKIFNNTVDTVTEFNTNIAKAWTSYWTSQQQQFTRAF